MEGLQLSGLASGFDWQSVVDQLIELERVPQQRLQIEQLENENKASAFSEVQSALETLKSKTADVANTELFYGRKAASLTTTDPLLSASAGTRTLTGTYEFHIDQLATASRLAGSSDAGAALGDPSRTLATLNTAAVPTSGTITVNGAQVTIDTADTLQETFDKIVAATEDEFGDPTLSIELTAGDTVKITSLTGDPGVRLGTSSDTSNFLQVMKLYSNAGGPAESTGALGAVNVNSTLNSAYSGLATPVTSDGSFRVNGVEIAFDADLDSIKTVMERINESEAGARISYDAASDQFSLTSTHTGSLDIALDDNGSGLLSALGLTGQSIALGQNAQFRLGDNPAVIESTSNTLEAGAHGIDGLSVTASGAGTESISVTADNSGALSTIESFIDKYNAVVSTIGEKTNISVTDDEVSGGTLAGDRDLDEIARDLRGLLFSAVSGLDGDIKRLADIGIDFKAGSNELEISHESRLEELLATQPDAIAKLFTDETDGIAKRVEDFAEKHTGEESILAIRQETLSARDESIDEEIERLERQIAVTREQLESSFIQMENVQARVNSQLSILQSSF